MAPTYPWNNARKKPSASTEPNFPVLTSVATKETGQKSPYEEKQEDELIALASIYGEDFQRLDTKTGAWKVNAVSNRHE
jgi:eukaryotic translation initiation factor 2-alpha kinase 4